MDDIVIVGIDPSINGTGCYKLTFSSNLSFKESDYLSFTTVKKNSNSKIISYNKDKDFRNYLDKDTFMVDTIVDFCKGATYIALEDYAFGANGNNFDIGQFVGLLKYRLYHEGHKLRLYPPTVVKKFATGKGLADKVLMDDSYSLKGGQSTYFQNNTLILDRIDLNFLNAYKSPKTDIIDAYFIAKLLELEVNLRKGILLLQHLDEDTISIFNHVSKTMQVNILAQDFLTKAS